MGDVHTMQRKTKIKKQSLQPMRLLIKKVDRQLQDWYRAKHPGTPCESCGVHFDIVHHFVEKSQSAGLRFEDINLIFLCHRCHFRHHRTGDQEVMSTVILGRGEVWHRAVMAQKRDTKNRGPFTRKELMEISTGYQLTP